MRWLLKKWWFWLIAVIVLLMLFAELLDRLTALGLIPEKEKLPQERNAFAQPETYSPQFTRMRCKAGMIQEN
jgi:hypothetical protein